MPVQDYTAMTRFFVVLILLLIAAVIAMGIGIWFLRDARKARAVLTIARRQNDAISQVIIELRSAPNLYAGFPQALTDRLFRLHSDYATDVLGKERNEIED